MEVGNVLRKLVRVGLLVGLLFGIAAGASAGTLVRVSTSVGDFTVELLDQLAPVTVQNFLNYVVRGDYNQTFFHRVETGFVVQGGAYRFRPYFGPVDVPTDPPIVNEFGVSNSRGTLAMAKVEGNPNSATNQWFVNAANNGPILDGQNGGFTVFGNVLGDGMSVVDAIAALPSVTLGSKASPAPYISASYTSPSQFVYMNLEIVERFSSAMHVFEGSSGRLSTWVSLNNGADNLSLNLNLVADPNQIVFRINADSIIRLKSSHTGIATFSSSDNRLRIPELELNINGVVDRLHNLVFVLSDPANGLLTLESWEP